MSYDGASIETWVTDKAGIYIAHLERSDVSPFRHFSVQEARSAPGAGSFEYGLPNDLVAGTPTLLTPGNLVWMKYRESAVSPVWTEAPTHPMIHGTTLVWMVEEFEDLTDDDGTLWRKVSGGGALKLLYDRRAWPFYFSETGNGLRPDTWDWQYLGEGGLWQGGMFICHLLADTEARFAAAGQILLGAGVYGGDGSDPIWDGHFRFNRIGDIAKAVCDALGDMFVVGVWNPPVDNIWETAPGVASLQFVYYTPSGAMPSTDVSASIIFREGEDITACKGAKSYRDMPTWLVGEGIGDNGRGLLAIATQTGGRRVEGYVDLKDVSATDVQVQLGVDATLAANGPVETYGFEIIESPGKRAFLDFLVGFTIGFEAPSRGYNVSCSIEAMTITEGDDDQVHVYLDLGSPKPDQTTRLAEGQVLTATGLEQTGNQGWAAYQSAPLSVWVGTVDITLAAAASAYADVVFPTGRFAVAPTLMLTQATLPANTQKLIPKYHAAQCTTAGARIYVYTGDGTSVSATVTVRILAIVMPGTTGLG